MPTFSRIPYPSSATQNTLGERYRRTLKNRPFLLFGLPFVLTMLAGSFFLTPATAVRYEKYDRKTHMLDTQEALGLRGQMRLPPQPGMGRQGEARAAEPGGEGQAAATTGLAGEPSLEAQKRKGASNTGGGLRGVRAATGRGEVRGDIREEYWVSLSALLFFFFAV